MIAEFPGPFCETCQWWQQTKGWARRWGHCHRYPPTLYAPPRNPKARDAEQGIPMVAEDYWCGEHKRREW